MKKITTLRIVQLTEVLGEYLPVFERSYKYDGPMDLAVPTAAVCNSFKQQMLSGMHALCSMVGTAGFASGVPGAGNGVYNINSVAGYANNALAGLTITFAAFGTAANNGTFLITASTATTITTTNTASAASGTTASATFTIGDVFKIALYTSTWTGDKTTTNYTATNEVGNSGTYSAGGGTLAIAVASGIGIPVMSTDTACVDFADISFTTATITARGALIYNSSKVIGTAGGAAVCVLDFGADKTSTAGTFTITFPAADASNSIVRVA